MERRLRLAIVVVPLLIVGLVSFVFVRSHQDDGAALITRQQRAQVLTSVALARVVKRAPDPVTHARGLRATCTPLGSGDLRNPWRCEISYSSGRDIQYRVTVNAGGSYTGNHELIRYRGRRHPDTGLIRGCCVSVP